MKQLAFWVAVAGTALIADPVMTLVADSQLVQQFAPGLKTLNDFRTKQSNR